MLDNSMYLGWMCGGVEGGGWGAVGVREVKWQLLYVYRRLEEVDIP